MYKDFIVKERRPIDVLEKYLEYTEYMFTWQPWAKVFLKSIIIEQGIRFDSRLYSSNDFNFFFWNFWFFHKFYFSWRNIL